MAYVKEQENQEKWYTEKLSNFIPGDHISRFIVDFVNEFFEDYDLSVFENKTGRPKYSPITLTKILVYASADRVTSTARIEDNLKYHQVYQYVAGGLMPSARTLRRFKADFGYLIDLVHQKILKMAKDEGFTDFDHIAIDGTIIKSNNSPYNMIRPEEIDLLLDLLNHDEKYINDYLDDKNNDKLRESAYNLLVNKNQSLKEKIEFLNNLKDILKESGQTSVGMHCTDARWMRNKKNRKELSFNVQASVDYKSKLIVNINAVQAPTDHHQLISQLNNILKTIDQYPDKISADYAYRGDKEFKFLHENGIDGYIPNQKQARENNGNKPTDPYHKHNFTYNPKTDEFICPENHILNFKNEYHYETGIQRVYYTNKCNKCPVKEKCTQSNVRTITEYGTILNMQMSLKMDTEDGKKEYGKRICTVEPVFGILKLHHDLDQISQKELKAVQTELTLMGIGYNLKRIFSMKNQLKYKNKKILRNFFKDIKEKFPNTKIKKEILI
jgi:transposase